VTDGEAPRCRRSRPAIVPPRAFGGREMVELILLTIAFTGWISFRYWQDRRKTRRAARRF